MPKIAIMFILGIVLFIQACSKNAVDSHQVFDSIYRKELFNEHWQKQGIAQEEWYYRMTVIDAPANSPALGIAEGHALHPDSIRWEITKTMLIAWKAHPSIIGADLENKTAAKRKYRGPPLLAFAIISHFDDEANVRSPLSWSQCRFMKVDWSRNFVSQLKRQDLDDGINSPTLSSSEYYVDNSWPGNPNRIRVGRDFIDLSTRHPLQVSEAAMAGKYGRPFIKDSAAVVIDIRHSFIKKSKSDFIPLASPDEVIGVNSDGKIKAIPINNRIGLFRTGFDGLSVYDEKTGTLENSLINNATIFNIWKKNIDDKGRIIPMEQRQIKPIIYYSNVLHPDDLMSISQGAIRLWDQAFRSAIFHAQPGKYQMLNQVPPVLILQRNSCNIDNIEHILYRFMPESREAIERGAKISLAMVKRQLSEALAISNFSQRHQAEVNAKRALEQICSSLEFYTADTDSPFIYQRPGDLRFNLINLLVDNNTTAWSGYGPMFSDSLSGETISATANINLKYIDLSAAQMSKQISLVPKKSLGLMAGFGIDAATKKTDDLILAREGALKEIKTRASRSMQGVNEAKYASQARRVMSSAAQIFSRDETKLLSLAHMKSGSPAHETHEFSTNPAAALDALVPKLKQSGKNSMMDPLEFIDNISIGVALKYQALSKEDRFLKIREKIYESVLVHEIGHNLGLRHNMAGASDALNYGSPFWRNEQLPSDLLAARQQVKDPAIKQQLDECLLENDSKNARIKLFPHQRELSAQECLQQKNGMYSSVMDYQASSLAGIQGLGLYDKAAIKWAYTQLVEVFPKENLKIDVGQTDLSKWLKFNDYRQIPLAMLQSHDAINDRKYEKFEWNDFLAKSPFPNNAVPYAYCEDPSGSLGPRCLAFDFGPDMKSSASWLRSRFWSHHFFTHFAHNESWPDESRALKSVVEDIKILHRFTHILHWFHYYSEHEPLFSGSFAEQDYLSAIAIGMNHFAHVIGLPEPGAHISAPVWSIEDEQAISPTSPRIHASSMLIPFKHLNECEAKSISNLDSKGEIIGRQDYKFVNVPLGMGRPYYTRMADDIENNPILYSGSSLLKKYALYLLSAPMSEEKSVDNIEIRKFTSMSWYQMFPSAVQKLYNFVINKNYDSLGPLLNKDNEIIPRDIIDENSLTLIETKASPSIMPALDENMPLFALASAIAFIPNTFEDELAKSIRISCKGCRDDLDYSAINDEQEQLSYTHLSGYKYKALKYRNGESIGAAILVKANQQKERYLRLTQCINNEQLRMSDPFCQCVKTSERTPSNSWLCCEEANQECPEPILESIGTGVCSIADLEHRRAQSEERLEQMVGFIHELRKLMKEIE